MNAQSLQKAIREAERFVSIARDVKFGESMSTAAARRASMDLTRALSEMRKAKRGQVPEHDPIFPANPHSPWPAPTREQVSRK